MLATAKIHILKQFTTSHYHNFPQHILCLLLQRYTFWSNSQPPCVTFGALENCACYCKDTHFEAIHNPLGSRAGVGSIVLATAKIHILKQFTTVGGLFKTPTAIVLATAKIHILKQFTTRFLVLTLLFLLCLLLQRYTFWSNSQPQKPSISQRLNCACYCKDTHFEAIHNGCVGLEQFSDIVLATAKIHILKQFTTDFR